MYVREVDGQTLTFQVSGKLWMRSLVMMDVETGTEWAHLLGRGMAGKLKGKKLKPLIADMVTWGVWKERHPETTALHMHRTSKDYSTEFYRDPKRFIFGLVADGNTLALPMEQMMTHPVHHFRAGNIRLLATFNRTGVVAHLFEPAIDGMDLDFALVNDQIMTDRQTGSRWERISGQCIGGDLKGKSLKQRVGIMSFRYAWQNFHPNSKDVKF